MVRKAYIALLLALVAVPVGAYVHSRTSLGVLLTRPPSEAANVEFFMSDNMFPGATNGSGATLLTADSDPFAALQQAAGHWDNPPDSYLRTSIVSTTSTPMDSNDGVNVIGFADTPELRAAVGGALAIARRVAFAEDGFIFDSDIVLSDVGTFGGQDVPFSTTAMEDTFHFTSVASHEIGHTHGLGHSGVAGATMFARTGGGTDLQEIPKGDDITFVRDIYGDPDVPSRFGAIQGTVFLSGGGTANGVFVAAMDPSTGFVVSTLTDFNTGAFDTGPIPPGNYFVAAEPVDGPAETFDYPRTDPASFNLNVREGFFGGNGSAQSPQAVTVTAGKGASTADFTIENGPKTLDIRRLGKGPIGQGFFHGPSPRELEPGEAAKLYLWGPGIDDPSISDANVRIYGDAVTIRPGSVGIAQGFGSLNDGTYEGMFVQMTVDAAPSVQGVKLASIAVFLDGEAAVFTGGVVVKGDVETGPQNPEFTGAGLTHSARLDAGDVAPEEIVALFGLYLADFQAVASLPLGTQLGGASVDVTDSQGVTRPCLMFGAFPENAQRAYSQLNFMIAAGTATGPATLTVRRASGGVHSIGINVVPVAPGVFTANASGSGLPAANILRFVNGIQVGAAETVTASTINLGPIEQQVYLSLFLTGVRNATSVEVRINGVLMPTVFGPAASPEFAGLDQLNVLIDRGLIGQGLVNVVITVNGLVANVVQINL